MEELCSACLCSGRKITPVKDTPVYYFYKQIVNEVVTPSDMIETVKVCWECCALLRRFQSFQQQARCCYVELLMSLQQDPPLKISLARPSRLKTHLALSVSLPDVKIEPIDVKVEEYPEIHCEPETFVNQLSWEYGVEKREEPDIVEGDKNPKPKHGGRKFKKKEKKKVKLKKKEIKDETIETDLDYFDDADTYNEPDIDITEGKVESNNAGKNEILENITENNGKLLEGSFETQNEMESREISLDDEHKIHENKVKDSRATRNREVLPEKPQCVECGKMFSSRKTYRYHINVLHKGENRHPCPKCGKVYQWKSNLARHMRAHKARDTGELYCAKCDKSFASIATYRQHIKISRRHVSESEFTFTCDECGKKFVNKTRLRDHIDWEHLNKIKFRCQICNKPYKCHTSLYVHMQYVHRNKDKKDNLCHVCGKSYQNAAKLKYHIVAMHTSETPYQCADCDAAFGWYSSLYRHIREVHYKMKVQPKKNKKDRKVQSQDSILMSTAGVPPPP